MKFKIPQRYRLSVLSRLLLVTVIVIPTVLQAQHIVPEWAKDVVWYQIFPERFANGDRQNDPPVTEPWGGKPEPKNYFGGDLQGIIDHQSHFSKLGVDAIYLNPVFESPTNHKYQTSDYMKIDHNFGDEQTFRRLLDDLHMSKIKLIIDGVFNHTSTGFFAFEDVKKNGELSKYRSWYNIKSFPVGPPDKPNYEGWWGLGELPKLMADTPAVRDYLFNATSYWTTMGLDGWRLDVPNEMSHDFWIQWRKLVKGINPDALIVGEIWTDASDWLKGDQFDAVMNYRFRGACVGFIALGNQTASQCDSILHAQLASYPPEVNYVLQNLIGSHDTERFLTLCDGDVTKMKLAVLLQMTYVGAPMIYYGDEIGMTGGKDPDCRKTMIWDTTRWNMDLFRWYQKLLAIRHSSEPLRRGSFATAVTDDKRQVYGFYRTQGNDTMLVVLNNGSSPYTLPAQLLPHHKNRWYELISDPRKTKSLGQRKQVVPAHQGKIYSITGD
jgi:cyclomaltodextrinase